MLLGVAQNFAGLDLLRVRPSSFVPRNCPPQLCGAAKEKARERNCRPPSSRGHPRWTLHHTGVWAPWHASSKHRTLPCCHPWSSLASPLRGLSCCLQMASAAHWQRPCAWFLTKLRGSHVGAHILGDGIETNKISLRITVLTMSLDDL